MENKNTEAITETDQEEKDLLSGKLAAHLATLLTIIIWGTTFISTKVVLEDFQPVEILFFRFLLGLFALLVVCPHRLKNVSRSQELLFAAAGLCGVCWPLMWG